MSGQVVFKHKHT